MQPQRFGSWPALRPRKLQHSRFLDLPAELRLLIFHFVLKDVQPIPITVQEPRVDSHFDSQPKDTDVHESLLCVCKQMRAEALPMMFEMEKWAINAHWAGRRNRNGPSPLTTLARCYGPERMRKLYEVDLTLNAWSWQLWKLPLYGEGVDPSKNRLDEILEHRTKVGMERLERTIIDVVEHFPNLIRVRLVGDLKLGAFPALSHETFDLLFESTRYLAEKVPALELFEIGEELFLDADNQLHFHLTDQMKATQQKHPNLTIWTMRGDGVQHPEPLISEELISQADMGQDWRPVYEQGDTSKAVLFGESERWFSENKLVEI